MIYMQVKNINVFLGESTGSGKVGKELDLEKMIRNDLKADYLLSFIILLLSLFIIRNDLKADNLIKAQGASAQSEEDPFADFESKLNVALPSRKNM